MSFDLNSLLGPDKGAPAKKRTPRSEPPERIPETMSESEIAVFLGVTASTIRSLTRDGKIMKAGPGRWDVRRSVASYVEHLRGIASRTGRARDQGDPLRVEQERLTRAKAERESLRLARERGEVVDAAEVEREWAGVLRDVRSSLLAVPSRVGQRLPALTPGEVAIIEEEIRNALEGLANDD